MASIDILLPFILSYEGGYSNHPLDRGGPTNKGVTLSTWRTVGYDKDGDGDIDTADLQLLTSDDVRDKVLKPHYWDRWQADKIKSQSVANILVDWVWASGAHGIRIPQRILGVKQDGIVGPKTLAAINGWSPRVLFDRLKAERIAFIESLVAKNPSQSVFRAGWLRRLQAIQYGSLRHNGAKLPALHTP